MTPLVCGCVPENHTPAINKPCRPLPSLILPTSYVACGPCSYEVVKKSRKAADELAERLLQFVDARGNVQCGIIYCLSR